MNLAQSYQRPGFAFARRACRQQEPSAISLHAVWSVLFGKAKIEASAPIATGEASWARAEPMDQPGEFLQTSNLQRL